MQMMPAVFKLDNNNNEMTPVNHMNIRNFNTFYDIRSLIMAHFRNVKEAQFLPIMGAGESCKILRNMKASRV